MQSRVGLLAAEGAFTGPWLWARQGEDRITIRGLGGGSVTVEHGSGDSQLFPCDGTYPFGCADKFRLIKSPGPTPVPTTVELITSQ